MPTKILNLEKILNLYGAETWTLISQEEKALDAVYSRLLSVALIAYWEDHVRNFDLYNLPRLSDK